ncbi:hypothetical protein GF369_01245 [Candidatus Peregrinibacteria bacterium]|nr:hypothetical protein [Candidatus Peregrinibacteria bacterium]
MKHWTTLYIAISLMLLFSFFTQRALSMPATPNPSVHPFPALVLYQVNIKNTQNDSVTITVIDDMNHGNGTSIKGLTMHDDTSFFTFEEDIYLRTNETITVMFDTPDHTIQSTQNGITVNLERKGLTGTTEQMVLYDPDGNIIDALCWTSDSPTTAEGKDMQELFDQGGWSSADPATCFPSEDIEKDDYLERISLLHDTDTKEDWTRISSEQTITSEDNKDNISKKTNPASSPESYKDIEPESDSEINTTPTCSALIINEIVPNPHGRDTNNEWIELKNTSTEMCSPTGWSIDDQEGQSKPYSLQSTPYIPPQKYLLLPSWETGINLNNTEETVRLFAPDEALIESISYEDAPDNESFSRLHESDEFYWTFMRTPYMKNISEPPTEENNTTQEEAEEKSIPHGDLSENIQITEVFPNPKGNDSGNEWIELYNNENRMINLAHWTMHNSNKTYTFPETIIQGKSYLVLSDKDLGFSLNNTDATITLYDFQQTPIDTVSYSNVEENHSYTKILTYSNDHEEKSWMWHTPPTPGTGSNPLYQYEGTIVEYQQESGMLTIEIEENQETELLTIHALISGDMLANTIFEPGTRLNVTIRQENNRWLLENHQILQNTQEKPSEAPNEGLIYIALSSLAPLGYIGYKTIIKYKFIKIV